MGFPRQEHWSGLPFPSPGDLPDPGITPGSSELQADSLPSEPPEKPDLCLLAPPIHKTLGPLMTVTLRKVLGRILQKQITNTAHYQRVNCNRYIFFATMKEGKKEKEKNHTFTGHNAQHPELLQEECQSKQLQEIKLHQLE